MDSKKPWESKTLWMNLLGAGFALFYPGANEFLRAHAELVLVFWSVLNMALRLISKGKIEIA